jgi:hypothetical protein
MMIRKPKIVRFAVVLFALSFWLMPAFSAFTWRKQPNTAFSAGEKLKFQVRWQFIVVGYATMAVDNMVTLLNRRAYHIIVTARSTDFFDNIYKVRNSNESWIDEESLCSLKFFSSNLEGKNYKNETIIFDQENGTFLLEEKQKSGPIPPCVQDVLSSLYYLRTMDLAVGQTYSIDAHSGDLSWPLKVTVLRREKVKVPAGEFETFVVEPSIRQGAGIFQAKGKLLVWLTADKNKMPVLMSSKIAVGTIVAELIGYEMFVD